MMPLIHVSFSLQLIALTLGIALFIWSLNGDKKGAWLGKLFGFLITVIAFISVACSVYTGAVLWSKMPGNMMIQMKEQMMEMKKGMSVEKEKTPNANQKK